jgi:hypothetical protein
MAAQLGPRELVLHTIVEKKALIGAARREESRQTLNVGVDGDVTAMQATTCSSAPRRVRSFGTTSATASTHAQRIR